MCKVTLTHKGIKPQCSVFKVPRNGPALLGMSDCKMLHLLSINCDTIETDHNIGQVNKQSK